MAQGKMMDIGWCWRGGVVAVGIWDSVLCLPGGALEGRWRGAEGRRRSSSIYMQVRGSIWAGTVHYGHASLCRGGCETTCPLVGRWR